MLHLAACTVLWGIPALTGYSARKVAISAVLTCELPKRHSHLTLKTLTVDVMADKPRFWEFPQTIIHLLSLSHCHFGWQFLLISHKDKQFPKIVISRHHVFADGTSLF